MIDLHNQVVDANSYGWKAHYLSLLLNQGYPVPRAFALDPDESPSLDVLENATSYAVRSSGLGEDGQDESFAGHFLTRLGVRGQHAILAAIEEVRASAGGQMRMAVIVQEMVEAPLIAGVAFSCHPLSLDAGTAVISWIRGLADQLVDGTTPSNDIVVNLETGEMEAGVWPARPDLLDRLVQIMAELERLLGQPVDVEWCVTQSLTLAILQVRPVVVGPVGLFMLDQHEQFASLPGSIRRHSKISLRSDALRLHIPMSAARIVTATRRDGVPPLTEFRHSPHSAGHSVVLLHPTHVDGKVLREFTKDCSTDVEFFVRGCHRYAIRQYPEQSNSSQAVEETLVSGLQHSHLSCVIQQELLHAYATGILRRTSEGYLVEAALGHFVPKGYVETSSYLLTDSLDLHIQEQSRQTKAYHFINGHVVVEEPPYEQLDITDQDLRRLITSFQPLLDERPTAALEFGLLGQPGDLDPYMIDVADGDADPSEFSKETIGRGIVSKGTARGCIVDLRGSAVRDDLNAHLYDQQASANPSRLPPSIYIARNASVDLLPLVRACDASSGFIFESASVLAHLAVVLRERGVPAVTLGDRAIRDLTPDGTLWYLDTESAGLMTRLEGNAS